MVFAVDIKSSAGLNQEFQSYGVRSEHVDAGTPTHERDAIYARFRSGGTQVLTNCMLASYGFDLPDLSCVVLARPKELGVVPSNAWPGLAPSRG